MGCRMATPESAGALPSDGAATPGSVCSRELDLRRSGGLSGVRADESTIRNICDWVLTQAFDMPLKDVVPARSVSAAYDSVRYLLDELARIVGSGEPRKSGPVTSQTARRTGGSGAVPNRHAGGGAADNAGDRR